MLADVIHLKSPLAETSKRILHGMVEGQEPRETTSPFSGHPTRTTIKVTLGTRTTTELPRWGQEPIAVQDLHSR